MTDIRIPIFVDLRDNSRYAEVSPDLARQIVALSGAESVWGSIIARVEALERDSKLAAMGAKADTLDYELMQRMEKRIAALEQQHAWFMQYAVLSGGEADPAPVDAGPAVVTVRDEQRPMIDSATGTVVGHAHVVEQVRATPPADDTAVESVIGDIIDKTYPDFSDEASGFRAEVRAVLAAIRRGEVPGIYAGSDVETQVAHQCKVLNEQIATLTRERDNFKDSNNTAIRQRDEARAELAALKGRKVTLPKCYSLGDDMAMLRDEVIERIRAAGVEVAE